MHSVVLVPPRLEETGIKAARLHIDCIVAGGMEVSDLMPRISEQGIEMKCWKCNNFRGKGSIERVDPILSPQRRLCEFKIFPANKIASNKESRTRLEVPWSEKYGLCSIEIIWDSFGGRPPQDWGSTWAPKSRKLSGITTPRHRTSKKDIVPRPF